MKIQLASDLHLEFLARAFPGEQLIHPVREADALVLAGDIASGVSAVEMFRDWPVPVYYVMGNHEAYGLCIDDVKDEFRRATKDTAIQFLERDAIKVGGVRILGCTLWTDYLYRCNRTRSQLMANAELRLNDHRIIRTREGAFTAAKALADHELSRAWLKAELDKPFEGTTVVVSHHGPHPLSVHPRYGCDALNAAFVSDLTELLFKVDLWLHGHVHDNFDYNVGGCRVVANPRGYAMNRSSAERVSDLTFENRSFQWTCVIDTSELPPTTS